MTLRDQIPDAERAPLVARVVDALACSHVPDHLRGGLVRYFEHGILPGGFLQAVLCMNLPEAVARHAGPGAATTITILFQFLIVHAPLQAWGSRDNVLAWTTTPQRLEIR